MNTLIIGGGIGGLTAAIALSRTGHKVTLIERTERFSPVGAGIVMAPNAAKILASLGVDVPSRGFALPSLDVLNTEGTLLSRIDVSHFVEQYGPIWALSRASLHEALVAAVPEGVELRLGHTVTELRDGGDGVAVTSDGVTERYDLVIGADGLRSKTREAIFGPTTLRYSGVTCWRGIAKNPGFERGIEAWGDGARIGLVPLAHGEVYYYLVRSAPPNAPELSWPEGFRDAFGEFHGEVQKIFDAIESAPPLHHDLNELDAPMWGRGRVFLLGDAAHAMTPNQGQGAAMAIEDALALSHALTPGFDGALDRYVESRHDRVRAVQLDSRRIGEVSHWRNPLARALRDGILRLVPDFASGAQYRRLIEPGLALLRGDH